MTSGPRTAYRAVGYELVDHAPIGSGRSSSTRMMELHRAMSEQVDMVVFPARMYVSGHVGLGYFPIRGMAGDGGVYEWEFVIVKILDEAGLLAEEHLFPIEQWDEALAFFDERSAATAETPALARFEDVESAELTNRATAAGEHARAASLRGDRAATIDAFAPDFRRIEGRPGAISGERVVGRDLYVDGMLAGPDAGLTHFDATTIEVVGDDHALTQVRWHNGEGSVQEWLLVGEVDGDGRLRRIADFDPEDRPAASALLHAWASGGPQNGDRMSVTAAVRNAALDRGDRDAVLATYTADFVREDHRRGLNFGTANREETVEALLAGNVVGLGNRSSATLEVVDDAHTLVEFRMSHIDGFEVVYLLAVEADEEGRLRRAANFDLEDRERASALLREWAAGTGHEAVASTGLTNAAVRTMDHFAELFAGFDWARVGSEIYADDLTNEDRRTGVNSGVTSGRAPVLELLRALADVGFTGVDHEPLAVRGDRLALFRRTWRRPDGFDLQMLDVVGIDEEGRQTVNVLFDVSDLASSLDELERRYLAGEGAEHERFVRSVTEFWRCYNTRDRDGVRAYLADDYRLVDHRSASAGTSIGSADDFLDDMQGMIELAPDMFAFPDRVPRVRRAVVPLPRVGERHLDRRRRSPPRARGGGQAGRRRLHRQGGLPPRAAWRGAREVRRAGVAGLERDDRGGERDAMVLGPRRTETPTRRRQHVLRHFGEHRLRVVLAHAPAALPLRPRRAPGGTSPRRRATRTGRDGSSSGRWGSRRAMRATRSTRYQGPPRPARRTPGLRTARPTPAPRR